MISEGVLSATSFRGKYRITKSAVLAFLSGGSQETEKFPKPLDNQPKQSYTTTNSNEGEADLSMNGSAVKNVHISYNTKENLFLTQLYYGIVAGKKALKGGLRFATREEAEAYRAEVMTKSTIILRASENPRLTRYCLAGLLRCEKAMNACQRVPNPPLSDYR